MKIFEIADDLILKTAGKICDDDVKVIVPEPDIIIPEISAEGNTIISTAISPNGETQRKTIELPINDSLNTIQVEKDDIIIPGNMFYTGISIPGIPNLVPGNIKKGETVYNVKGAYEHDINYVRNIELENAFLTSTVINLQSGIFTESKIFSSAFEKTNFSTISIADNINKIENAAFRDCQDLNELLMNNNISINYFGTYAFCNCYNLSNINARILNPSIGYGAFKNCSILNDEMFSKLSNCTYIGGLAFENCKALTNISLDFFRLSSSNIGSRIFRNCTGLNEIHLVNNLTDSKLESLHSILDGTHFLTVPKENIYPSIYIQNSYFLSVYNDYLISGSKCLLLDRLATENIEIINIDEKPAQIFSAGNFSTNLSCLLKGYKETVDVNDFSVTTGSSKLSNLKIYKVERDGNLLLEGYNSLSEGEEVSITIKYKNNLATLTKNIKYIPLTVSYSVDPDSNTCFINSFEDYYFPFPLTEVNYDGKTCYSMENNRTSDKNIYSKINIKTDKVIDIYITLNCQTGTDCQPDKIYLYDVDKTATTANNISNASLAMRRVKIRVPIGAHYILVRYLYQGWYPFDGGTGTEFLTRHSITSYFRIKKIEVVEEG